MRYRPEVDGLRAFAIVPVLAYHLGWGVSGGYVGVDVFFVISGYLITSLVAAEVERGSFTLAGFYARRARRLLPALFAMLAACYALGAVLLLPDELSGLGRSALGTILFASNVHFWQETDYFAAPAELQPLLHTWSLAVEEQFYIVFPFMVAGLVRHLRRWSAPVVAGATLLLLAASAYAMQIRPAAAFYLIPFRAWELLLGAALGLRLVPQVGLARVRAALTWLGLALILGPVFAYGPATPFPGLAALPPTLGAALVIHCCHGGPGLPHRLLINSACIAVGRLSYSLYLWHWPLIVFGKYIKAVPLGPGDRAGLAGLTVLCAWLCYRFVEAPARHVRLPPGPVLGWSAAAMLVMAAPAGAALLGHGFPGRFTPETLRLAGAARDYSPRRAECHAADNRYTTMDGKCVLGGPAPPRLIVWGDSHAVELAFALGEVEARHGRSVLQATYSACPPALGFQATRRCAENNAMVLRHIQQQPGLRLVVLAAYTAHYLDDPVQREAFKQGMRATVEALVQAGKAVALIEPIPKPLAPVPDALARLRVQGRDASILGVSRAGHDGSAAVAFIRTLERDGPVAPVVPAEALCGARTCRVQGPEGALYFDDHHLSLAGARLVVPLIGAALERAGAR